MFAWAVPFSGGGRITARTNQRVSTSVVCCADLAIGTAADVGGLDLGAAYSGRTGAWEPFSLDGDDLDVADLDNGGGIQLLAPILDGRVLGIARDRDRRGWRIFRLASGA
jgi:hypothetical protein